MNPTGVNGFFDGTSGLPKYSIFISEYILGIMHTLNSMSLILDSVYIQSHAYKYA